MPSLVDSSSLLSLALVVEPLDRDGLLRDIVCDYFASGEWLLLESVRNEVQHTQQGVVLKKFPCLRKDVAPIGGLVLSAKEQRLVDSHFIGGKERRELEGQSEEGAPGDAYQALKKMYLGTADPQLIFSARRMRVQDESVGILTEESFAANDGKYFRKIPFICRALKIPCARVSSVLREKVALRDIR